MEPATQNPNGDLSVDDAIATLVGSLPKAVQDFVLSPERDSIVRSLTQKYQLRIDDAGAFQRAFILLLLGVQTPEEFASELQKEGFSSDTIQGLTNDINERVFKPIREKELSNPSELAAAPAPAIKAEPESQWVQVSAPPPPQRPLTPAKPLTQTPIYTPVPVAPSVSAFNQPSVPSNPFVPQAPANVALPGAPVVPTQIQAPQQPAPYTPPVQRAPVPQAPRPAQPSPPQVFESGETVAMVRTMGTDMDAVRRGQQPSPHVMNIPQQQPRPTPPQPVQPQQWAPPQSPAPQQTPPPVTTQPKPQYTRPYIPPTPRVVPKSSPTPASGDPYREPIE